MPAAPVPRLSLPGKPPNDDVAADQDPLTKYRDMGKIGKGAFGSAHLLVHKDTSKYFVIKKIRLAKQTGWQRSSALQERDMMAMLQHPFIVPHVESWVTQGHTVNVVLGYCERGDLGTLLEKRKGSWFEEARLRKWMCQMLLALDYLQASKVLHRDIKISNLLLTAGDDVQLSDFGLATYRDAGDSSKREDTNMVGTPQYMSPELLSQQHYSFQTDVWSLGCCFYELSAQKPAFNAFNLSGLVTKIKRGDMPRLPLDAPYSREWEGLLRLMINKDPLERLTVQQLMGRPELAADMHQARQRALELQPDLQLPPLLPWEQASGPSDDGLAGAGSSPRAAMLEENTGEDDPHTPPPAACAAGRSFKAVGETGSLSAGAGSEAQDECDTEVRDVDAVAPSSSSQSKKVLPVSSTKDATGAGGVRAKPASTAAAAAAAGGVAAGGVSSTGKTPRARQPGIASTQEERVRAAVAAAAGAGGSSSSSSRQGVLDAAPRDARSASRGHAAPLNRTPRSAGTGMRSAMGQGGTATGTPGSAAKPQQSVLDSVGVTRRRTTSDTPGSASAAGGSTSSRVAGRPASAGVGKTPRSAGGVRAGGSSSSSGAVAGQRGVGAGVAARTPRAGDGAAATPRGPGAGGSSHVRQGGSVPASSSKQQPEPQEEVLAADDGGDEVEAMPVQRLSFGSGSSTPGSCDLAGPEALGPRGSSGSGGMPQQDTDTSSRGGGAGNAATIGGATFTGGDLLLGISPVASQQQQQQQQQQEPTCMRAQYKASSATPPDAAAVAAAAAGPRPTAATQTSAPAAASSAAPAAAAVGGTELGGAGTREAQLAALLQFHAEWAIARGDRAQLAVMAATSGLYRPELLARITARLSEAGPCSELEGCSMRLGERVTVGRHHRTGCIEYIGPMHNSDIPGQIFIGLRMIEGEGSCSGVVDGVPYIDVGPGGAMFMPAANLQVSSAAPRRASASGGSSRRRSTGEGGKASAS